MISKASLFNKTIYKNTLSRFKWGSFLYFIILFFSTAFLFLMQDSTSLILRFQNMRSYVPGTLILRSDYLIFPILLALIVPTITAVLAYGNVHSSKQSIFIHSLPATRKQIFVSVLLASLTLMALPVLGLGIIFLIMSLTSFGTLISVESILIWILYNLAVLFIMFSVACFAGFLTGHPAAHIGINVLIHLIPVLIALFIYLISGMYLFGFAESENFIASLLIVYNPVCFLFVKAASNVRDITSLFSQADIYIYLSGAVLLYLISFFTYKARKIETCGDVAAFSWLKPVLKYTVSASAGVCSVAILYAMETSNFIIFFVSAIISAIAYFIAEMLLLKTVKVFKNFKGYLGFVAVSALVFCFCAFTSMFGYETRIPEKSEISKATISENWGEETLFENEAIIDTVLSYHEEFIKDIPIEENKDIPARTLSVTYELKNGKTITRRYNVSYELFEEVLNAFYEYPEYKLDATEFSSLNIENVEYIDIHNAINGISALEISPKKSLVNTDAVDFLKAVKQDVLELNYSEIHMENSPISFSVDTNMTAFENKTKNVFIKNFHNSTEQYVNNEIQEVYYFSIRTNANFKNTLNYLKSIGYIDELKNALTDKIYILNQPAVMTFGNESYSTKVSYKQDFGEYYEFSASADDLRLISKEDAEMLFDMLLLVSEKGEKDGTYYGLYIRGNEQLADTFALPDVFYRIEESNIPDFLQKYLTR